MSTINTTLPIKGNALASNESIVELAQRGRGAELNHLNGSAEEQRAIARKRNGKKQTVMAPEQGLVVPRVDIFAIEPLKLSGQPVKAFFGGSKTDRSNDVFFTAARSGSTFLPPHFAGHGNVTLMPPVNNEHSPSAQVATATSMAQTPIQANADAAKNSVGTQPDNKPLLAPAISDGVNNDHDGQGKKEDSAQPATLARLARDAKDQAVGLSGQPLSGAQMRAGEPMNDKPVDARPQTKVINVDTAKTAPANSNTFTYTFKASAQGQALVDSVQVSLAEGKTVLAPNNRQTNDRLMNSAPAEQGFEVVFDSEGQRQQHNGDPQEPATDDTQDGLIATASRNRRSIGA